MSGFLTPLRVESVDDKTWILIEPLVWEGSKGDTFTVDAGEETAFATVPWWTQAILPRTGTWTKASVLHDKMCNELNRYYRGVEEWLMGQDLIKITGKEEYRRPRPAPPAFSSVDADAVFRKIARDSGTDWIRSELLWLGVRYGALANPARRPGWLSTAPRVVLDTLVILAPLAAPLWWLL